MGKEKKLIEYRFYEMPQGHYVLALLGPSWERVYGADVETMLHFHNYLEIGYCYWGEGTLIIDETNIRYKGGYLTLIPENIPHTTTSIDETLNKWEYLFIDINGFIKNEMKLDRMVPEKIIKQINKQGYAFLGKQYPLITEIVKSIIYEYTNQGPYYKEAVKGYLRALVVEMLRISEEMSTAVTFDEKRQNSYIEACMNYIEENYSSNIRIKDLAENCGLSESHFRRVFEEIMQMKPLDYVNMVRIKKACEIIEKENMSMAEVGLSVGFDTPSTFDRNFKKIKGVSPRQWKRDCDEGLATQKFEISAKKGW